MIRKTPLEILVAAGRVIKDLIRSETFTSEAQIHVGDMKDLARSIEMENRGKNKNAFIEIAVEDVHAAHDEYQRRYIYATF